MTAASKVMMNWPVEFYPSEDLSATSADLERAETSAGVSFESIRFGSSVCKCFPIAAPVGASDQTVS